MDDLIGRICIKLVGREAGKKAVIVNNLDKNFVLIDGNVKRRKCNINHLEVTKEKIEIEKDASTSQVHEAMKKLDIKVNLKKVKKEKKEKSEVKDEKQRNKQKSKQRS